MRDGLPAVCLAVLLLLTTAVGNFAQEPPDPSKAGVRLVVLEGSPYNRGLTHGRTLKKEINQVVGKWKAHLEADYKMKPDEFIAQFFKKTDFLPAIKKWTPDLLAEVRGIADGAGVDFNTMLLFQLPDEEWVNAEAVTGEHCSGIGVNQQGKRPAMIAQNLDISGFYNGYQTLLRIKDPHSDLETLVFTCAGLIALNGMSNKSVGVTVNTLAGLTHSTDGLPVAFVIRGLLEQKSQKDAIKFLHAVKHASGQNYILGGKEKVYDFECSAKRCARYIPFKNAQVVYHTNHPLANDDVTDAYRQRRAEILARGTSRGRFHSLESRLKDNFGSFDVDAVESTLKSHDSDQSPVCRRYRDDQDDFTFGSIIMIFSDKPELRLAAGPPDSKEYVAFSFSPHSAVAKK